jgi:GNAT superfamily N-acetyltransferase
MNVRLATPADAETIAALHAESWRNTYRGILRDEFLDGPIFENRRHLWHERLSLPDPPFVTIAEVDARPQGFVCAFLDVDPVYGALVDNLHVALGSKGHGLGRRLMHEAARWIGRQRPRSGMHLWVYERNLPARQFYERLGGIVDGQEQATAPDGSDAPALRYRWTDLRPLTTPGDIA